jgi:hypothetical protein
MAALNEGKLTRREICKATGLTIFDLNNLFKNDRELFAAYTVRKKLIADMAADNIMEIVNDPSHPQHFQASKFILTKYKSEFEDILESVDSQEIAVEVAGTGEAAPPVIIRFGKKDGE